jgi:alpha-tubulin suppressor-like RCC1 family protein
MYSNVTPLPVETSLDASTGQFSGNITSVLSSTLFSFDVLATDEEMQDTVRTFLLQLIVLFFNAAVYTDASWTTPLTQTALDSNVSGVYWTIDGQGMNDVTSVLVDGTPATSFTAVSDAVLRVQGPQKPRGTYDVTLVTPLTTKVFPNSVVYSDVPTWVTPADLGDVDEDAAFSISLQAISDSDVTYANVTSLPPSTTLNPTTGNLEGTITGVSDAQFYFDVLARDQEYQDAIRSFILRCLGVYVAQIAGYNHTLALSNRGQLITWGNNAQGQTGVGTSGTVIETPQDVTERGTLAGRTITAVAGGGDHSVALTSDGAVHCWGYNDYGQCGQNNQVTPQLTPVVAGGALAGQTVTAISCGLYHTLALAGGTVYAWGYGLYGQIGNGGTSHALTPVAVTGGSLSGKTIVQVRAGAFHSMALASDGTVHMWGWRVDGAIPGGTSGNQTTPTDVSGFGALTGKTVVDIQTGYYHSVCLCSDGSVISWGRNWAGQVGIGNTTDPQNTPQDITNNGSLAGKTVSQIFVGMLAFTSFAIASDGSIHAWGSGGSGTIGDGGATNRTLPVDISAYGALAGQPISRLGGGLSSVYALRDDAATVSGWGDNTFYQLDPDGTHRNTPADVSTMIMGALSMRKLVPSDSEASANFGFSVSLNAAGDVALVGAYLDDATGGADSGAAYVFTKGSGSWTQTAKLVPSDGEAEAGFGFSVSLNAAGNVALVGAISDDATGGANSGAAYVFTYSSGSWTETTKLVPSDSEASAYFGFSVSLNAAGDVALVGAYFDDATGGAESGAAYVFTYSSGSWTQTAKLIPSDSEANAWFGISVSLNAAGDVALVGAILDDATGGENSGAAYVFTSSSGSWTQTTKLVPSDSEAYAIFGSSVSLNAAGNVALVGANSDDANSAGSNSGAAYVFTYSVVDVSWAQTTKLVPADSEASAQFGCSVSLNAAGDVALVGARYEDATGGNDSGAAYVFQNSGSWTQTGKLCAVDAEASAYFGMTVAIDSAGRVGIVGAYNDDAAGGSGSGAAYTFKLPAY